MGDKTLCPYCSATLDEGSEAHSCPTCGTRHHRECWRANGGCAVVGCESAPAFHDDAAETTQLPPIAQGPEAPLEVPASAPRRRRVVVLVGALAILAMAAIGGAVALVVRDASKGEVAGVGSDSSGDEASSDEPEQAEPTSRSGSEEGEFTNYTPGNAAYPYVASLPKGSGWLEPVETEPTGGELLRTTVRGPQGTTLIIDRTPNEVPQLGGRYQSSDVLSHPVFGSMTEYVFSESENIPECQGVTCIDYLIDDGQGGGWGVLAGGPDLALSKQTASRVARSITNVE